MRTYLPQTFTIENWDGLKPYFEDLKNREIPDKAAFMAWLKNLSELESVVSEDLAWRYIKMTCNTTDKALEERYIDFVSNIQPHIAPYEDEINKKISASPYLDDLEKDKAYFIYFRGVKNAIALFREENIPLYTEIQTLAQQYGSISGAMSVEIDGKTQTLQQASNILKETDRERRKMAYENIGARRLQDKDNLDELFDKLIHLRHRVALNAGFDNFRDYMHQSLGRFDYSVNDCFKFHEAIKEVVVPLSKQLQEKRRQQMGLDKLRPYDLSVDAQGRQPLKPFTDGKDLLEKSIACFSKLDTTFGENLALMSRMNYLDLDSRIGKAPGGYNYPLAETGIPFIFMNAAGSLRDVETMVHEGGHAMHAFLSNNLELNAFKNAPMEVAEVASMSMELVSMNAWDVFFSDAAELKRAKTEQLEGVIQTLPWIATIDKFQHWLYTHPNHTRDERKIAWVEISDEFDTGMVDISGYEENNYYAWQKQLHLYEVPFYYIEYGFAQLGAIGIWKNYVSDQAQGLQQYKDMLSLGYTKTIPELYTAGGIRFDFSRDHVKSLFDFVQSEMAKLNG